MIGDYAQSPKYLLIYLKLLKFIFSLLFIHKKLLYIYQFGIMIFLIFHNIYNF